MKIYKIIHLLILFAFSTIYSQNFWERTNGLDTTNIYSLAINSNGDIFAGTKSRGLFRSTDNGSSWTNLGFTNAWVHGNGIVITPSEEILIAVDNQDATGGVFRSSNNGNSWDTLGLTFNAEIAIALNSSGNIFVGTAAQGVYRSTDNGLNFIQVNQGLNDTSLSPVSFTINTSGHIFVGTVSGGGVFRSTDNGDNWVQINNGITNYKILSLTNSNGYIFAGAEGGGVFRSTDNGNNWSQINQGITAGQGYFVNSLLINQSGYIFAGTSAGVFRSTDNGNNWVEINQGLTNTGVLSLAKNSNGVIFAGTLDGVFQSIISANLKVYLQGPYSGGGAMTTILNTNNQIPLNSNSTYPTATYSYIASTVTSIPNSDIVDWVLVELRTGTAAGTKVATRAGFLKSDGTIVDTNGTSPLIFTGLVDGNYNVVVRHYNHLAIMTALPIPLSGNSVLYDFSSSQSQAYGTNSMIALTGGGFGLYAGDSNRDGQITALDFNTWNVNTKAGQTGYVADDMNLDGQVTALDFNFWNVNTKLGAISNVP
jgi:photosystem II stability/assembly factor-like uncharacterized protein